MISLTDLMREFDRIRALEAKGFKLVKVGDAFADWGELRGHGTAHIVNTLGEAESFAAGYAAANETAGGK